MARSHVRYVGRESLTKRAARAIMRAARRKARERWTRAQQRWRRAYEGGGRADIDRIHWEMQQRQVARAVIPQGTTGRAPMARPPVAVNNRDDQGPTGLMLPEGQLIRRAALGIGQWMPGSALEVTAELTTIGRSYVILSGAMLTWVETLASMRCDPRIVNPLIGISTSIGRAGADVSRVHAQFVQLYAGDLLQDDSPARPMVYPVVGAR